MKNCIKDYWLCACGELKKLRMLTFGALCCALGVVIGGLYVAVGENLRVYFTFFVTAMGCAVYGPVMGMLVAAVTDTLNFIMFPTGPYFPGYMLGEMLGALIYGGMLYRKKITILRIFLAKFGVNYIVNVLLGCLWSRILYGKGYLYYLVKSLIKNTLLLPVEVMALGAMFALLIPVFAQMGLLPRHRGEQIDALNISGSVYPVLGLSFLLGGGCSLYYTFIEPQWIWRSLTALLLGAGSILLGVGFFKSRKNGHRRDT